MAAKGEQRQYFRHHRRSDCDSGQETGVHILAKEILAESLSLFIPRAVAKHGDFEPRTIRPEREWPFQSARIEKTLVGTDGRRIGPDLIVEGDFKGESLKLLIEIHVRHKQEPRKEAELRKRGLAAIEIDLSAALGMPSVHVGSLEIVATPRFVPFRQFLERWALVPPPPRFCLLLPG